LSIIVNLGFLGVFKYYDFFASSFSEALSLLGFSVHPWLLDILLPVGISFYTFHGLSYLIDVYNRRIVAERNFVEYAVFVSFFPLLVAGPIERATHLLPQIKVPRSFDYGRAVDGMRQILWGLFKKVVIADNCAEYANIVFDGTTNFSGSTMLLGAVFFSFQIYGDFSGYSDIALGTARLFGIELLKNFSFPYFSRDIAEFWRRWHISLSGWFRDYLYIPLGGNKGSMGIRIRNTFIIFIVSGFWHGANWTFIFWGALHAIYFLPLLLLRSNRNHIATVASGKWLPTPLEFLKMTLTFLMVTIGWIFFRAVDLNHAFEFIDRMVTVDFFVSKAGDFARAKVHPIILFIFLMIFFVTEWLGRESHFALQKCLVGKFNWARILFYFFLLASVIIYSGKPEQFIYFQF
jgi:D-alanyl-lipoteichoic acid acyltransferase DltB (MBOAT superfamily)